MSAEYKVLKHNLYKEGKFSLVPIRMEDRMSIMKWRNEQIYHLRQPKLLTIEDQDNYFKNVVAKLFEKDQPEQILFSFLEDGKCIGYGGAVHINWIDKNAEVSFIMETELEALRFKELWLVYLRLLEQAVFGDLGLHKLHTYAFDVRQHVYPMLEEAGFKMEGRLKEQVLFDGKFIDAIVHGKISTL